MCGIGICIGNYKEKTEYLDNEIRMIATSIQNRGPDSFRQYELKDLNIAFLSSVLSLRGEEIVSQPLISPEGDVFLWNGEVFGGYTVNRGENDTKIVFQELIHSKDIIKTIQTIQGPFSFIFYHKANDILYIGKDPLGRRSLILHYNDTQSLISISSSFHPTENPSLENHQNFSPRAFHELYENHCNPGVTAYKDIPPTGVFTIQRSPLLIDFIPYTIQPPVCRISSSLSLQAERMEAANTLITLLEKSLWKRISTIDRVESPHICVMFSGGIDCSILVCLLCRILKTHRLNWVIELANISYGDTIETSQAKSLVSIEQTLPDRYTAYQSFNDIIRLFPDQTFHFVEINIPNKEIIQHEESILECVFPGTTQMDFQIGCCYYFISRGSGRCLVVNKTTNEQIRTTISQSSQMKENKQNVKEVEAETVAETVAETQKCKTKNCKQKCDEMCSMRMCSVCCLRVQNKARAFNEKNLPKKRTIPSCPVHHLQPTIPHTETPSTMVPFDLQYIKYSLQSKILVSGIGADEMCGGYIRYQSAFDKGSLEDSWSEMQMDWNRLWFRNLGRDDRCISEHGREMRAPFLDEEVSSYLHSLPINLIADFSLPRGQGDKMILRNIASILDLQFCLSLSKRAIQFGSRIVKEYNTFMNINTKESKGEMNYRRMSST